MFPTVFQQALGLVDKLVDNSYSFRKQGAGILLGGVLNLRRFTLGKEVFSIASVRKFC